MMKDASFYHSTGGNMQYGSSFKHRMISIKTILIGNRFDVHVISDETASCAHTKLSIRNDKHEVCLNRVSRKRSLPTKI